jgi:hypothetical protein
LLSDEFPVRPGNPEAHQNFMVFPFSGIHMRNGGLTNLASGFEISMYADARYLVKDMYQAYPWGNHGLLIQHPSAPYEFIYSSSQTDHGLETEIINEHQAFRTAIADDAKRLTSFSLLTFEDDINHELILSGKTKLPIRLQRMDTSMKMNGKDIKSNLYHRLSWRVITETRLLEDATNANAGLDAMNDLLQSMP